MARRCQTPARYSRIVDHAKNALTLARVRFPERGRITGKSSRRHPVRHLSVAQWFANSVSMNVRHAAALALMGWYLMVAPVEQTGPFVKVDVKAPLKEWDAQATFDDKKVCENARTEYLAYPPPCCGAVGEKAILCVASDDPRLRETK
jgi:hypothetical protein